MRYLVVILSELLLVPPFPVIDAASRTFDIDPLYHCSVHGLIRRKEVDLGWAAHLVCSGLDPSFDSVDIHFFCDVSLVALEEKTQAPH